MTSCHRYRAKPSRRVYIPKAGGRQRPLGIAENDIVAYCGFPVEHRRQIWSTDSLERLNKEVSRRCDLVGIFPNHQSLLRLTWALLDEQNDDWAVGRRYFSTESMNKLYEPTHEEVVQALLELQGA